MNGGDTATNGGTAHHGAGHRGRLRQRLLQGGGDALLDHELIEYLLALAIPRRDTKQLAKELLAEFGGIAPLLAADPEALLRVKGMGETVIAAVKVTQAIAARLLKQQARTAPTLSGWQALQDYLRVDMGNISRERIRVLHLNGKNQLIRDEVMSEGTIDTSYLHTREVIRRAIELGSAAIILVHNHPSGDPQPSASDIALTREIAEAGKTMGVVVHDHVIVGANSTLSMLAMGLI